MLKLLILCKTPDTIKNITNKIVSNISELRKNNGRSST